MAEEIQETNSAPTRAAVRNAILSGARARKETVMFFGQEVEVHQPTMGDVLDLDSGEGRKESAALMLVRYTYMPGTKERVFEDEDVAAILEMPFAEDLQRLQDVLNRMMGVDVKAEAKNSEGSQDAST